MKSPFPDSQNITVIISLEFIPKKIFCFFLVSSSWVFLNTVQFYSNFQLHIIHVFSLLYDI